MVTVCDSAGDSWLALRRRGWYSFLFLMNIQERGKLRAGDAPELNVLELLLLDNLLKRNNGREAAYDGESR